MTNLFYFTDRNLKSGFNITLESHHNNQANSMLIIKPNYPEFGIEVRYINNIIEELYVIYARLINHYKFNYQTFFSARFDEQDKDNQLLDETEIFNYLNINQNLAKVILIKLILSLHYNIKYNNKDENFLHGDLIRLLL